MFNRRILIACAALAMAGMAPLAQAQGFPNRPVTMVVPFAAGGITDGLARMLAQKMGDNLGQSVIVDNRPGGGGQIAAAFVRQQPADGHTIFVGATEMFAINPTLFKKFSYDPVKDFTPITSLMGTPMLLVVPANSPINSLADLVKEAKTRPSGLSYASQGVGSIGHLLTEMFRGKQGGQYSHVAYKGSMPALQDLTGGHVDFMFDVIFTAVPLIEAGKLKPLAIAAAKRTPQLPNVPTLAEAGAPGLEAGVWFGAVARAGTPAAVVNKLNAALLAALKDPEVLKRGEVQGMQPVPATPAQFGAFIQSEINRWTPLVKASGATMD